MSHIILVTGGCRSGKSSYAEELALAVNKEELIYLATCPKIDDEMDDRILRHQESRAGKNWQTIEEETDLIKVIKAHPNASILVDCLTLWVSNLMWQAEREEKDLTEAMIFAKTEDLLRACRETKSQIVFVSNETGMGIMPVNKSARLFGDLAGRCNQTIAKEADEVVMMVSGLPMKLKG